MEIPMPGDIFKEEYIVIASCYFTDEEFTLLLLGQDSPHYAMVNVDAETGELETHFQSFMNIIEAVSAYQQETGCH